MKKADTKQSIADKIWLQYFNQTLYEQGIISESRHNKLMLKIDNRVPPIKSNNMRKASS